MHQYFFLNFREPHQVHVLVNFNQITLFYNCVAIDADKQKEIYYIVVQLKENNNIVSAVPL